MIVDVVGDLLKVRPELGNVRRGDVLMASWNFLLWVCKRNLNRIVSTVCVLDVQSVYFLSTHGVHARNRTDIEVNFLAFDLQLVEKSVCDEDICWLVIQNCIGQHPCWRVVLMEDFDENYSSAWTSRMTLIADSWASRPRFTGINHFVPGWVMQYSGMFLSTNLAI